MEVDINEDDLLKKHKQERKDLQSKIQALKKSVTKGDKKKKKEVTDEISKLEEELENRQAQELKAIQPNTEPIQEQNEPAQNEETTQSIPPPLEEVNNSAEEQPPRRTSRAAKRRNKKAQDEKEREMRIMEQAEKNKEGPRVLEINAIKENLKNLGLELYNIPADGNCLYYAVNHQLGINNKETYSIGKLRKLTADFLRENREEFLPFMYNESDETVSEEYFEAYCKEVASTKLWGGQLELRALSQALQCPIKIIQASGPPTIQGDQLKGPELILAYHRHLYRLGEHYNSTIAAAAATNMSINDDDDDDDDEEENDD